MAEWHQGTAEAQGSGTAQEQQLVQALQMLLGGLTCGPGAAEPQAYGTAAPVALPWVGGLGEGSCRPASPGWGPLVGAQLASSPAGSSPATSTSGSSLQRSVEGRHALPAAAAGAGSRSPTGQQQRSPAAAAGPQLAGVLLHPGLAGCSMSIGSGGLCTALGAAAQRHSPTGSGQPLGRQHQELDKIQRTVYVGNIPADVTEVALVQYFADCGTVLDCRLCSALGGSSLPGKYAFLEFLDLCGAQAALCKSGAVLGGMPLRVCPSKTAIVPVRGDYLPSSTEELEAVARTVYVAGIARSVKEGTLEAFLSNLCGPVSKLRLLGDTRHATKVAFVEFSLAEDAQKALTYSGVMLGSHPLRIAPSKTPVRMEPKKGRSGGRPGDRSANIRQ